VEEAVALAVDGQYSRAAAILEELLRANPNQAQWLYYLGLCRLFDGDRVEGQRLLARSVELGAEFPEAFVWLARVRLQQGDEAGARQAAAAGLRRFPRNGKLRLLAGRGVEARP
jgi:predicted Zn-dependent protease